MAQAGLLRCQNNIALVILPSLILPDFEMAFLHGKHALGIHQWAEDGVPGIVDIVYGNGGRAGDPYL